MGTTLNFVLPQFVNLRISNMTTFPQDLGISFKKGINVIFGGNYSGKTTIISSLRYGTFGLSWGHTVEGIEKRYFASRVREIDRKSLDINLVYNIKPITMNVHRTVFSSGSAEIEAKVSKSSKKSLSASVKSISREKQYHDALTKFMGLIAEGQLGFIPSLIFADEDRQPILWKKDLEYFVLSLLTSSENISRLQWIESQIDKAKKDFDELQQDRDRIIRRNSDNERNQKFLLDSLRKVKHIETDRYAKEYEKLNVELKKCRDRSAQIDEGLQAKLNEKSNLLLQLNNNQKAIHDLKVKSEQLDVDLMKVLLNPSNPDKLLFVRHLYHKKECPFCWTDLSEEIDLRIKNKMCLICGQGVLMDFNDDDVKEIKQELSNLKTKKKGLNELSDKIQTNLDKIKREIENLTKSKEEERIKESSLVAEIAELKGIEEDLHKKEVMSRELEEIQEQTNDNKKLITKIDKNIKEVTVEIDKINQLYDKTKMEMRTEIGSILAKIRERFSIFISSATNGEVSGRLSPDFVPILNGRTVFYPESASQFERTIMDYAFRIALLSIFAEKTKTCPSLVIETPDEVTDESYIPYLAKAMLEFSSNLSVIVTTVNTEMMKQLLSNYKPNERKKRLVSLIAKGTLTQRKFYQTPLNTYLSERL